MKQSAAWCIRFLFLCACVSLVFAVAPARLQAQTSLTAVLRGTVLDPVGSVVSSAGVLVRDESSKIVARAATDPQGQLSIDGVAPGTYTVEVSAEGFALASRLGVVLTAGQTQELSISMAIGLSSTASSVAAQQ